MTINKIPPLKETLFSTTLEVRINDINYGNHLGHDSLISLLHEARVRFLQSLGFSELNIDGVGILITSLLVNYMNEAFYSEKIKINIGLGSISKTSVELIYQAINYLNKKEICRALTAITFYDYEKEKICKIPQKFLSAVNLNVAL